MFRCYKSWFAWSVLGCFLAKYERKSVGNYSISIELQQVSCERIGVIFLHAIL